ncbi:hypothetical protein C2869_02930 [Saccharobesus litoralis]|uniref:Methyl-accepting chemotaxis protein n=1 Tax=Saccharobesus litoralis TaxID=2172099 RepID=A0A2S0VMP4_9ALTE|nr:methyl-accepting chemotaxis protein [Saccharobesus litoralis]AWB65452.1 hypothetical protein C2869_02930 [Saccharobesus litoralis]
MLILSNIRLLPRIIVIILLPLAVVSWLSYERVDNALQKQNNLQDISTLMTLINESSQLLTALQDERDYSFGYFHSKKQRYSREVEQARKSTDKQISSFNFYVSNHPQLQDLPRFYNKLVQFQETFNELNTVRDAVEQLKNKVSDSRYTFRTYKDRNLKLINLVEEIISLADNKRLSVTATNLHALMQIKDITSEMRGVIFSAALGRGTFGVGRFRHFINIEAVQAEYKSKLLRNGSEEVRAIITNDSQLASQKEAIAFINQMKYMLDKPIDMEATHYFEIMSQLLATYNQAQQQILNEISNSLSEQQQQANSNLWFTLSVLMTLVTLISLISYFIVRSINRPLAALVKTCRYISQSKDMGHRVESKGSDEIAEVAQALNSLLDNVDQAVKQVYQQTHIVTDVTSQVASAMQTTLQSTDSQNQATDNVSVAMNEMTASISEVAQNSQLTSDAVQRAHSTSVQSAEKADQSRHLMLELINELGNTSQVVERLNDETNTISSVLNVIQGIAEQTNLLALNAAIEAARAGEQGRGFAVVADEVRGLASRTQESTKQISDQIEALQAGSHSAVTNMGRLQTKGEEAVTAVVDSVQAFAEMKDELDTISGMSSQIATAAEEQNCVANEINERIHHIKHDAEQMAEHAHSAEKSCDKLVTTGDTLRSCVDQFQVS